MQDFITREPLAGVKAQILSADSVLLFEWTTNHQSGIQDMKLAYILLVPEAGDYLLRFSKEGYAEKTVPYKVDKTDEHQPPSQYKRAHRNLVYVCPALRNAALGVQAEQSPRQVKGRGLKPSPAQIH